MPDVAIVDLHTPDGSAIIAGIRAVSPRTHVIVLSGYDDRMLRVSAAAAGAQAYLVKGVHPGVVAGTVRDVAWAA
jgi:DNA-binding NarL/FixJ family response regulator